MTTHASFARALATADASLETDHKRVVSLDEWVRTSAATRRSRYACASSGTSDSSANANGASNIGQFDILDADFIDFHRGLKEYMMDAYGLMGRSEAADLHAVIARHANVVASDTW